jgi:RNA polymerase sigma-70 factor (ECF subfamily)
MQKTELDISETYQELLPELKSFVYRLTCDKEVSGDIAQDTFIKVIEKINQFKNQSSFKTWIFSIATNIAIDWLRKRKRWKETAQDDCKSFAQSDPIYKTTFLDIQDNSQSGSFDFREHINFCFTCIAKTLTIEQQLALILKDIYDFKTKEISFMLNSPEGTIKHWLFTARKLMSEIFDRRCTLINKKGVCHQCSELNGLFNPKQQIQENIIIQSANRKKEVYYKVRAKLVKAIDPLNSNGSAIEDEIMQVLRISISDK